jgi:hypothetical protein
VDIPAYETVIEYANNGKCLCREDGPQDTFLRAGETADYAAPAVLGIGCLCYSGVYALE